MDFGIKGRRALVLGGSRGLGAASADALAAEGVEVLRAARSGEFAVDLADQASVGALLTRVLDAGGVDILVNNGGGPKTGPAHGQSTADWTQAFATLASSLFTITDTLLPKMIERGWGRIITIGSSGVEQPIPGLALSNGVRGAVAGWSKTLAGEVGRHGVTVNMVLPGRIDTDRVRQIDANRAAQSGQEIAAIQAASRAEIPVGRYGEPAEFGAVVAFLASRQASFINGSMVRVDGGMIRSL